MRPNPLSKQVVALIARLWPGHDTETVTSSRSIDSVIDFETGFNRPTRSRPTRFTPVSEPSRNSNEADSRCRTDSISKTRSSSCFSGRRMRRLLIKLHRLCVCVFYMTDAPYSYACPSSGGLLSVFLSRRSKSAAKLPRLRKQPSGRTGSGWEYKVGWLSAV